jgi:myo-inositol-1(or 4)-monophosphatase
MLGLVYDPYLDEMYVGDTTRRRATLNGVPFSRRGSTDIEHALAATGVPYRDERMADFHRLFASLTRNTQGVRVKGPASLDLCYVAIGRLDVYIEFDLFPWDYAAGLVIAEAAGAVVSAIDGSPLAFARSSVLAADKELVSCFLEILSDLGVRD